MAVIRLAVAMQALDLLTFLLVTALLPSSARAAVVAGAEAGPLRYIWSAGNATGGLGGPLAVIAAKCAAVALVLAVLAIHARDRYNSVSVLHTHRIVLAVMALFGALGVISNVGAL